VVDYVDLALYYFHNSISQIQLNQLITK
jgi:hypothetical protein